MARRKKIAEPDNHERWLVSYADFITLLFAFFVVMYSISSVNEGKYRVLSDSMEAAFREPAKSMEPIQIVRAQENAMSIANAYVEFPIPKNYTPFNIDSNDNTVTNNSDVATLDEGDWEFDQASEQIGEITGEVEESMETLIDDELINVRRDRLWMEVEIKDSLLFTSGSAEPSPQAQDILSELAQIFVDFPNQIHVEGFTDNLPITNSVFPSNWELSSARAAAVVRLFEEYGIEPFRMASVGYGEHQPITENVTVEGRAQNRRVVIVVVGNLENEVAAARFSDLNILRQRAQESE